MYYLTLQDAIQTGIYKTDKHKIPILFENPLVSLPACLQQLRVVVHLGLMKHAAAMNSNYHSAC